MKETKKENSSRKDETRTQSANWVAVLFYIYLHIFGIIGLYFLFTRAKWMTVFYFLFLITFSSIGLTAGAHRLYAHQTFAANKQLRFFLVLAHTLAGTGSIQTWVFWHRIHHKYYGTERDPYNHNKGFIYSHVISNLLLAPSDLQTYTNEIDMRDVQSDGYIWIQHKFYWILFIVLAVLLPIHVPLEYWNESMTNSFLIIGATRLAITTNISWLINSALLVWGLKKGDKLILVFDTILVFVQVILQMPKSHGIVLIDGDVDDNSVFFLSKSYWLNYHYMLPWDWKNDEFGSYETGFVTFIIKMWYELGFIDDMKTAISEDVREALYKNAMSNTTMNEALAEIKENAEKAAHRQRLKFYH